MVLAQLIEKELEQVESGKLEENIDYAQRVEDLLEARQRLPAGDFKMKKELDNYRNKLEKNGQVNAEEYAEKLESVLKYSPDPTR